MTISNFLSQGDSHDIRFLLYSRNTDVYTGEPDILGYDLADMHVFSARSINSSSTVGPLVPPTVSLQITVEEGDFYLSWQA